jgi:hypothetical protein
VNVDECLEYSPTNHKKYNQQPFEQKNIWTVKKLFGKLSCTPSSPPPPLLQHTEPKQKRTSPLSETFVQKGTSVQHQEHMFRVSKTSAGIFQWILCENFAEKLILSRKGYLAAMLLFRIFPPKSMYST